MLLEKADPDVGCTAKGFFSAGRKQLADNLSFPIAHLTFFIHMKWTYNFCSGLSMIDDH
jgi:hypothetical protein